MFFTFKQQHTAVAFLMARRIPAHEWDLRLFHRFDGTWEVVLA